MLSSSAERVSFTRRFDHRRREWAAAHTWQQEWQSNDTSVSWSVLSAFSQTKHSAGRTKCWTPSSCKKRKTVLNIRWSTDDDMAKTCRLFRRRAVTGSQAVLLVYNHDSLLWEGTLPEYTLLADGPHTTHSRCVQETTKKKKRKKEKELYRIENKKIWLKIKMQPRKEIANWAV